MLMVGLVKIRKRCQKWILHAKISRKSGITQLWISICFQITFPIWPPAAILDFWLLTNSAAIFARVMGANFFLNTSKSSNQVSNLTMLSVVTGPPNCTQLRADDGEYICRAENDVGYAESTGFLNVIGTYDDAIKCHLLGMI